MIYDGKTQSLIGITIAPLLSVQMSGTAYHERLRKENTEFKALHGQAIWGKVNIL